MGLTAAIGFGAVGAAGSLASAGMQASALGDQGEQQKFLFDINSRLSTMQSDDALRRGDEAAGEVIRKASQVRGSQRAAYAAQGIDVDSGSAALLQDESDTAGRVDAVTIRNNAWREAWGYKVEAAQASASGQFAKRAADTAATATLITGGLKAAGSFADSFAKWGTGSDSKRPRY